MNTKSKTKEPTKESPKSEEKKSTSPRKGPGQIVVRMAMSDGKNEWNFPADGPVDAIVQGKQICKDNGFRFPQDIIVWDFS